MVPDPKARLNDIAPLLGFKVEWRASILVNECGAVITREAECETRPRGVSFGGRVSRFAPRNKVIPAAALGIWSHGGPSCRIDPGTINTPGSYGNVALATVPADSGSHTAQNLKL